MNKKLLDLYSDYLISSFSKVTATGLSELLDGEISHDQITRYLNKKQAQNKELWLLVKETIRKIEADEGVIIFDDTIEEKAYTDENEIICWHWDHGLKRNVKGVNMLNCLYQIAQTSIPLSFEIVAKTKTIKDPKTGQEKRIAEHTKNEMLREMLWAVARNQVKYRYVLADTWYSSVENMEMIKLQLKKDFIMPVKANRLVALSLADKLKGNFVAVESLALEKQTLKQVFLAGLEFPVLIMKQIFTNKDGSSGLLYLVTSDLTLTPQLISTIYHKRWKVEAFHKSLKSNLAFSRSPTHTKISQTNHFFASIFAFFKLELLTFSSHLNHFALKSKLYIKALKASWAELSFLRSSSPA